MKAFAVIIAGGSGERLWPLSTPERPKQFVSLFGGKPLIRQAMDRLRGLVPDAQVLVVTAQELVAQTRKALPALPAANILAEPCRRNTAPAVALATREVMRRGGPDAVCCILTSDQLMEPVSAFRKTLKTAIRLAAKGEKIVTLGIRPTYAATGFGYIDTAAKPPRFIEKPDAKKAGRLLKKGTYLWNSGMFIFRADLMASSLRRYAPDSARVLDAKEWKRIYPSLTSVSVDYAVMEKTRDIAVVPADFRWDDVGSWNSVPDRFRPDGFGNTRLGRTAVYDTSDSVVISNDDHLTAVLGLKDVVVVHTDKATLVCAKSRAQDIKKLLTKVSLSLFLALAFGVSAFAERYPYERYKSIVDRQMFGPVPSGFDPTKPPSEAVKTGSKAEKELTKEQEKIKSAVRFSAINVTPSGEVAVGFSDSSNPKEVRHYYLKVGEQRDGWTVKAADPLKAAMTIAKGDITLDLELGANSANGGGAASAAPAVPAASGASVRPGGEKWRPSGLVGRQKSSDSGEGNSGRASSGLDSIRERRLAKIQMREAKEKAAAEDQAKRDAETAAEKARAEAERAQLRQELDEMKEQRRLEREEKARKDAESAEQKASAEQKTEQDSSPQ